jgi:alpha-N-arabinofuranosidase
MRKAALCPLFFVFACSAALAGATPPTASSARIEIDANKPLGAISPYLFGQNLEYEHGAVSGGEQNMDHAHGLHTGGLWAEMLRDRKFEQDDKDKDGVADAWVPEERIANRYYELVEGKVGRHGYRIDTSEYYGGGASQAIDLTGSEAEEAGIVQVYLHLEKGQSYSFYVYLKRQGTGSAWVELTDNRNQVIARQPFSQLTDQWAKYEATLTATETVDLAQLHIGVKGKGTFWIDSASLMPANNVRGMRGDVLEAAKPLEVPILRYPGGCFADTYHWKDGIGNRDKRPERWNPFWNEWEPNDFGFDDFMAFTNMLGIEPHITLNSMAGTPAEAADWVQYANGSVDTPMGKLRAQNGHPEPYKVKYWAVGNEVQQLCSDVYFAHSKIDTYVDRFLEYRKQMKTQDSSIEVFAVGAGPGPMKWNADLLAKVPDVDAVGVSIYTGSGHETDDFDTKIMDLDAFYKDVAAEPLGFTRQLQDVIDSMGDHLQDRPLIAVTEFQAWWLTEKVDADLRLADALYLAGVYNSLFRHTKEVRLAEIESLINVQGVIEASQTSLKLTPEYFTSLLYRKHTGHTALTTATNGPTVPFNGALPALDSMASLSADEKILYVAVVNRSEDTAIRTSISVSGWKTAIGSQATAYEINGKDKVAFNPFGSSENVNIKTKSIQAGALPLTYSFPAHSVTILELSGAK